MTADGSSTNEVNAEAPGAAGGRGGAHPAGTHGCRLSWLSSPVSIGLLALAALAAGVGGQLIAAAQDRGNLVSPSIALDRHGLGTVAWTEVASPGIRVAQESRPGAWTPPALIDPAGGPGSVAVGGGGLAHVAYVSDAGLRIADQVRSPASGPPRFSRRTIDPRGVGRPSLAITPAGREAIVYQTSSGLRVALQGRRGGWRIVRSALAAPDPQIASAARRLVVAGLQDYGVGILQARPGRMRQGLGFATLGSIRIGGRPGDFDLTTERGAPLVAFARHQGQLLLVARPAQGGFPVPVAATAGVGGFASISGTPRGRAVVLSVDPRFRVLRLSVLDGESRLGDLSLTQGQEGEVAIERDGSRAEVAYWDPGGRELMVASVGLRRELSPYAARPADARTAAISTIQKSFPSDGKAAIWLSCLALLLTIVAGLAAVSRRRRGMRLLPFAVVLAVFLVFAARGAYVAQTGIYGIPPNALMTLDRDGVKATVDALSILCGAVVVLGAVGWALPAGWHGRLLERASAVRLPSRRGAAVALALFTVLSLAAAASVLQAEGLDAILKLRQTAFADQGYKFALLMTAAAAWLVYFAVVGWPPGRRERLILVGTALVALLPLLISGSRTALILGFLVPIVLLVHLLVRPLRARTVAIGLICLLAFAVGARQATRGGTTSVYLKQAAPGTELDTGAVTAFRPALGWTEAAGLDGFILVRSEYLPQFGTNPGLTAGAFAGIPVPRAIWPSKPKSAMDTFSSRLNPWDFAISRVGQTTTLAGEFTMNWGLAGVFLGFGLFAVILCLGGELLAGTAGTVGILVAAVLVPRTAAAVWGDSFSAGWGAIVIVLTFVAAVGVGRLADRFRAQRSSVA
ncbi:MAG: O-antigen polymerase [Solirubrobacterales bacterium]